MTSRDVTPERRALDRNGFHSGRNEQSLPEPVRGDASSQRYGCLFHDTCWVIISAGVISSDDLRRTLDWRFDAGAFVSAVDAIYRNLVMLVSSQQPLVGMICEQRAMTRSFGCSLATAVSK